MVITFEYKMVHDRLNAKLAQLQVGRFLNVPQLHSVSDMPHMCMYYVIIMLLILI
jgi:hypothetical protein